MKKKYVIGIVSITILLIILSVIFFIPPKFELKGGKNIEIKYGEKYKEPGYKVTKFGQNLNKNVKITNKIKNKVGTYDVIYKVKIFGITFSQTRTVKIVDLEKPVITLNGNTNVLICPNSEYQEEGYKAIDNYDGDITEKIKITKKDNIITYFVKDSSNNEAKVTRKIIKEDKTSPSINLNGN